MKRLVEKVGIFKNIFHSFDQLYFRKILKAGFIWACANEPTVIVINAHKCHWLNFYRLGIAW